MDPLTASLNLATAALALANKVWDATPKDIQSSEAAQMGLFVRNIGAFITSVQDKINAAVKQ